MKTIQAVLLASAAVIAAGPASAHHSFAMFDRTKELTATGTIKEFQWTNPHVWVQVYVPDPSGAQKELSLEAGSPGMMVRTGWASNTLNPGDKVSVVFNPMKSGAPSGNLVRLTLPNGKVLGPGGTPGPPPPAK